ncbi:MAG TPA: TauD/TfdA family dioxygenase [Methylomirabilota bacterium]|nr:TauD/TfdA family dioxygenase [Methylomirabilota bacterium]
MTSLSDFVTALANLDIRLWVDGGKLRCSGPEHLMTPELRSQLAARKTELLTFLAEAASPRDLRPAVARADSAPAAARAGRSRVERESPAGRPMTPGATIAGDFDAARAWRGTSLPSRAGVVAIPDECHREIAALVDDLRANPLPLAALRPGDFEVPACRALMEDVKHQLDEGLGFAVLDRLDLRAMRWEDATAVHWLLASMVARPVAQKWDGTLVHEVCDLGKRSMRAVNTNDDMNYHTDNSFNVSPPRYVGLLCLQKAKEGGLSKLVDFRAVHNELRRRHPDLLGRLYRPFLFDRQREHAPGDEPVLRRPVFESHGDQLVGRMSRFHVRNGYALAGEPLDRDGEAALAALDAIMNEPGMAHELSFEPGQIQLIDNWRLGHRRTAFTDWPEEERRRRLVRLWLRDAGRPFYNG